MSTTELRHLPSAVTIDTEIADRAEARLGNHRDALTTERRLLTEIATAINQYVNPVTIELAHGGVMRVYGPNADDSPWTVMEVGYYADAPEAFVTLADTRSSRDAEVHINTTTSEITRAEVNAGHLSPSKTILGP